MTVSALVEANITRLHYREHFKVGTIAAQLDVHPDVVKRVLGLLPQPCLERKARGLTLAPYVGFIAETLKEYPRLCSTRLYDMLCERKYVGSPRTVRRYVQTVRPKPAAQVFLRLQVLPGAGASGLGLRRQGLGPRGHARLMGLRDGAGVFPSPVGRAGLGSVGPLPAPLPGPGGRILRRLHPAVAL